jgi:hypothetical protein
VADYTPVSIEGEIVTSTASAAIVGGALLVVSGNGTVAPFTPGATPAVNVVGVAASDVPSGGRVSFYCRGPVHESVADGTVTAGDEVVTSANGGAQLRSAPAAAVAAPADMVNTRAILGVALTTAANLQKVRWMQYG